MKLPISLVVITLNEEKNLARCLASASFCNDIVVLDSESIDQTKKVAESCGARVFTESWRGFGVQKQRAVELAAHEWVLCLDADEVLSPALSQEIQNKFTSLQAEVAYQIPRKSFYLGRWILHGGWYPDYQLRLFHRKHWQWDAAEIHEKVRPQEGAESAGVKMFSSDIEHYVFQDVAHHVATNNRYSSLQAEQYRIQGGRFSLMKLIVKPASKFLECYIWKLGFLDGLAGFVIAIGAAYSVFIRWAKIWQMSQNSAQAEQKLLGRGPHKT
jgi:glycosyltransferase involved in cell wall biosynthesis